MSYIEQYINEDLEWYAFHMRRTQDNERREGHRDDLASTAGKDMMKKAQTDLALIQEQLEAEIAVEPKDGEEVTEPEFLAAALERGKRLTKEGSYSFAELSLGNGLISLAEALQDGRFSPATFAARFTFYTGRIGVSHWFSSLEQEEDEVISPFKLERMRDLAEKDGSLASHFKNPDFLPKKLQLWVDSFYARETRNVILPLYASQAIPFSQDEKRSEIEAIERQLVCK